jgi:hypothetical protein
MYSRMIVESKTAVSPSRRAGTSSRGLAAAKAASPPKKSGSLGSKGTSFSRSAIFTFCA